MSQDVLLAAEGVWKWFGAVAALRNVSVAVRRGAVTCVLGDNGAGKSTLIQIMSGVFPADDGTIVMEGQPVRFNRASEALARGVATAYQDLALVPIMPIYRNFCLGREPVRGWGPFRRLDKRTARESARGQLRELGIKLDDVDRPVGTMSGGQRQVVAIARAVHAGAKVLILDEPTAALGRTQAGIVLKFVEASKARGLGVLLITHNVHHAFPVGDSFTILEHGAVTGTFRKGELSYEELGERMAGLSGGLEPLTEQSDHDG
jgi:simple sugar transport system ATP-binding protein